MHSYISKNGTTFRFNRDYSGDIICHKGDLQFKINGEDFVEFAKQAIVELTKQAIFDEIRGGIEVL